MKFNIGDRAIVTGARYHHDKQIGVETTITGAPKHYPFSVYDGLWYPTDLPAKDGQFWWVAECDLRPVYDGNEPVAWKDCVWQPKETRVC
jgi:hypothetical protein